MSPGSLGAALKGVGGCLAGVDAVLAGEASNAFVATRPPGHHATRDRVLGFCLLNHVAVGARYAQDQGIGQRILIVDWDLHHGNGTQSIFYGDPDVFYFSLHQSPHFPGTGLATEVGEGPGEGTTLNVPLPPGTPREEYRDRFTQGLDAVKKQFSPDVILISCGFDVLSGDPLGEQGVEPEDLYAFTREVMGIESAGGKVVTVLEGGYVPERVGEGSVAVLRALAGLEKP
jgi:acetoin utilization deacetylase AcuC-like enzyme